MSATGTFFFIYHQGSKQAFLTSVGYFFISSKRESDVCDGDFLFLPLPQSKEEGHLYCKCVIRKT